MNSSMMDPPLSTGNTSTTVFLYLPLSTDAPDLLGFASVNGFYGPGSWAAFFLAICASWISLIFQSTSGVVSLCAYLLALNAVAVDHLRHLHALTRLKNSGDPSWTQKSASVAAAYIVTWWGLCTVFTQILTTPFLSSRQSTAIKRLIALIVGSILPAASSAATLWLVDIPITDTVPALYWKGMVMKNIPGVEHFSPHEQVYWYSAWLGIWILSMYGLAILVILYFVVVSFFGTRIRRSVKVILPSTQHLTRLANHFPIGRILIYTIITFAFIYVLSIVINIAIPGLPLWTLSPMLILGGLFLVPLYLFTTPVVLLMLFGFHSIDYIIAAYLRKGSKYRESCFFMPCAPQSIDDFDQTLALLGGLVLVVVFEGIFPYWRRKRGEKRLQRTFEVDTEQRIELSRRRIRRMESRPNEDNSAAGNFFNTFRNIVWRMKSGVVVAEDSTYHYWTIAWWKCWHARPTRVHHVSKLMGRNLDMNMYLTNKIRWKYSLFYSGNYRQGVLFEQIDKLQDKLWWWCCYTGNILRMCGSQVETWYWIQLRMISIL